MFDAPLSDAAPLPAMQQHPHYARAVRALGGCVETVTARGHTGEETQIQILKRAFGPLTIRWMPRIAAPVQPSELGAGPILAIPDRAEAEPVFRQVGFRPVMTAQHVAELDLIEPEPNRRFRLHGKWRNRLRHAEAAGLNIRNSPFRPGKDDDLLKMEQAQRFARKYTALPPKFTRAWAENAPKTCRVFRATRRHGLAAFVIVLLHAPTASYHIGWTGDEGRQTSAHNLLLWTAANWLAMRGYHRFDLGTVDTDTAPGLARFKIGTGAHIRPLGPTMLRLGFPHLRQRRR